MDIAIGLIADALKESGILPHTTVIETADHGGHGTGVRPGIKITTPVSTMDTAAAALRLLGVKPPTSMEGKPVECAFGLANRYLLFAFSEFVKIRVIGVNLSGDPSVLVFPFRFV